MPICNTAYNSKGCQNSPRFLAKLSPVFVSAVLFTFSISHDKLIRHRHFTIIRFPQDLTGKYFFSELIDFCPRSSSTGIPSSLPQTKTNPDGLLPQPAAEAGAGLREEPVRGGAGEEGVS